MRHFLDFYTLFQNFFFEKYVAVLHASMGHLLSSHFCKGTPLKKTLKMHLSTFSSIYSKYENAHFCSL